MWESTHFQSGSKPGAGWKHHVKVIVLFGLELGCLGRTPPKRVAKRLPK
jgi:hypothetical protein